MNLHSEGYIKMSKRPALVLNHFEYTQGITTKGKLIYSLKQYYEGNKHASQNGYTVFDTTPTTFVLQKYLNAKDTASFLHRFKELSLGGSKHERVPYKHCSQNVWLVKPIGGNQGRGI